MTDFEWDDDKRRATIIKHKIDFFDAIEVFSKPHVVLAARSEVEARHIAVGEVHGRIISVVFTLRGDACRIITARRARRNEREEYQALHAGTNPPDERRN